MRSRGNAARVHVERALRVLTLTALAFAAWSAAQPEPPPVAEGANESDVRDALDRWTSTPPGSVHLSMGTVPPRGEREWLRALRRAGTPVTWAGVDIPPLAMEVAPVAEPRGGAMIWVTAPSEARVSVSDGIGPIDTVVTGGGGATLRAPITIGPYVASIRSHVAAAHVRDTILPRRVLVLGRAGWEAKFVIAALEEAGWPVDARLSLAPGLEVAQGFPGLPDTARHAAVVVLDVPAPTAAAALTRYVRAGGGVVLAGAGARAPSLAAIAAGRTTGRVRPSSVVFAEDTPRRALGFLAIVPGASALVLEEQGGRVAIAARRAESGRVVQVGYDDSWRWRMGGRADAVEAHRMWWSALVAGVAYRATAPVVGATPNDGAPLAALVEALGPPTVRTVERAEGAGWRPSPAMLFALISTLLLAEIASRRLRGAA